MFADFRPILRIEVLHRDGFFIDGDFPVVPVGHEVNRGIFHIGMFVEVGIEFVKAVAVLQNQDILIGLQFGKNRLFFRNRAVDDHQFAFGGNRVGCVVHQHIDRVIVNKIRRVRLFRCDRNILRGIRSGVRQIALKKLLDLGIHVGNFVRHALTSAVMECLIRRIFRRSVFDRVLLFLRLFFGFVDIGVRVGLGGFRRFHDFERARRIKQNPVFQPE